MPGHCPIEIVFKTGVRVPCADAQEVGGEFPSREAAAIGLVDLLLKTPRPFVVVHVSISESTVIPGRWVGRVRLAQGQRAPHHEFRSGLTK